jgi:hypothetical protein
LPTSSICLHDGAPHHDFNLLPHDLNRSARVNTVQLRSPVHGGGGGTPSAGKGAKLEATRVQIRPPAASIQGLEAPPVQMAQLMASTLAEKGRPALAPAPVLTLAVEQVPACRGTQRARQGQVEAAAADPAVEAPRATKGRKPPSLVVEGHAAAGRPSALLPVLEELHATTEQARVHLVEARAHVQLDGVGNPDDALWHLDTGATNHMTGSRAVFSDIDEHVTGTVRFGDGSLVNIEGQGTVLFSCKTGEHRQLAGVYLIPRLDINLISVGQLDEDGYDIHVDKGVMRIRDERRRLLARVRRSPNRLYSIRLDITHPVCLTARRVDTAWRWHERFGHITLHRSSW